jgi:general secretion pathway protein L
MFVERAWRWWVGEIVAMLPARWRAKNLAAEVVGDELVFSGPPAAHAAVKLHIGAEKILRRTLRLPVAARFRLRGLLAQDLERQSPVDPALVLFTFRILAIERAASQLLVSLILVRREVVEAAVRRVEAAGLRLKDVFVDGEILRDEVFSPRRHLGFRRHLAAVVLAGLAVLLVVADLAVRAERQGQVLDALNARAARLDAAAAQVESVRDQVESLQTQSGFLAGRRAAPSMGVILAAITRALPDGTWLYSLDYDGETVQLQGYSTNAAALVAIFDGSALFRDAAFRAPMTQGPAPGLQQFDLSMNVAGAP